MAKVLLVEPDLLLGETYRDFLAHKGHVVQWRQTAEAAVQALDNFQTDVVILELQMASHNGLELLYEIRSYQDWQKLPIVIHTVIKAERIDIKMLKEQIGIVEYIVKSGSSLQSMASALQKINTTVSA